jgi:hypothetical protein
MAELLDYELRGSWWVRHVPAARFPWLGRVVGRHLARRVHRKYTRYRASRMAAARERRYLKELEGE